MKRTRFPYCGRAIALALLVLPAAGNVTVTTVADESDGSLDPGLGTGTSLREAVTHAVAGSVIDFAPSLSGQTLVLTAGQISFTKNLTLDASGLAAGVSVSGNNTTRVFDIPSSRTVSMTRLKIAHGDHSGDGGGIRNAGSLSLTDCELTDNQAGDGGGAIENSGPLTLTACTLAGNHAAVGGGAIEHTANVLTLINCTLTGNTAEFGGAIDGDGTSTINLRSCTITANHATNDGGGLEETTGTLLLENTIVADNTAADQGPDIKASSINTQHGVNLLSSTNGLGGSFSGIVNTPLLSSLGGYGGPTRTMPPLAGSPAIDAGGTTTLMVDQRGLPRVAGVTADIGAVEVQSVVVEAKLEVLQQRDLGLAAITNSPFDLFPVDHIFDGDLGTLWRSAAVNPAYVQVAFTTAKTITKFRSSFSSGGPYQWKVEKANTQADMDGHSGSWAELFPWQQVQGDDLLHDFVLPVPVTAKIYRLVVERLMSDDYVHINEWELHELVSIGSIDVVPAALELPHPSSWPYSCLGQGADAASYDITGLVEWSSSNPGAATVASDGTVTTMALGDTEIRAHLGALQDHGDLTVVPLMPAPGNFTATAYHSTAHLTWNAGPSAAVGYVVYRRTAAGSYSPQPTAYIGLRQDHTDYDLEPGETYFWKIAAHDRYHNILTEYAETSRTLLASGAGLKRIAAPKLLIALYHGEMTQTETDEAVSGLQLAIDWYYRNSEQRFLLDATWMLIDAPVLDKKGGGYSAIEDDLRDRGVKDGQYDLCFTTGAGMMDCLGGFFVFNGTTRAGKAFVCGNPYPAKDPNTNYTFSWALTHEIHHAIDLMVNDAGGGDMFNPHFHENYPLPPGMHVDWSVHYDGISKIMRVYDDYDGWSNVNHGDYIEVWDTDDDDMADSDLRLAMDEARFGSTIGVADTDADGLSDGREYDRYIYTSLDPANDDTDGDGRPDGVDPQPLYAIPDVIPYTASPPAINGLVEAKWSRIRNGYFFTKQADDFDLEVYANYDDDYLYLAFRSTEPSLYYRISLDGSGHLGRYESDVRHPDAVGGPDNRKVWYADVYDEDSHMELSPNRAVAWVYQKDPVDDSIDPVEIPGSQVVTDSSGGWHTTEARIPRILPHGCGFTYFAPDAPTVQGLQLVPGRIFGLNVTMSPQSGKGQFEGLWTGLFETYNLVDFTLSTTGDLDGDGLDAAAEGTAQTDPLDPDTDGDGMDDGWEVQHGLLPLTDDAGEDPDGDGFTNLEEWETGTDPRDPASRLQILSITSGAPFTITWSTVHGRSYIVETSETLDGAWTEVTASLVTELDGSPGTEDSESWTDTDTPGERKFYRVRLVPIP